MNNLGVGFVGFLQAAMGDEGGSSAGDFIKAFPNVSLDNEIFLGGFVFERDKRNTSRSTGSLTN